MQPLKSRPHQEKHQPVTGYTGLSSKRLGVISLLCLGVIFGILAGLALWKGGVSSFRNKTLCSLGCAAVGGGVVACAAAAILAKDKKEKKAKIQTTYTPTQLARFQQIIDEDLFQNKSNYPQILSNEIMECYSLLNVEESNLPPTLRYSGDFIARYLQKRQNGLLGWAGSTNVDNMCASVKKQFIDYIAANGDVHCTTIKGEDWPANYPFPDTFLVKLTESAGTLNIKFSLYSPQLRSALITSLLERNEMTKIDPQHVNLESVGDIKAFTPRYCEKCSLQDITDGDLRSRMIEWILDNDQSPDRHTYSQYIPFDLWPAEAPFTDAFLRKKLKEINLEYPGNILLPSQNSSSNDREVIRYGNAMIAFIIKNNKLDHALHIPRDRWPEPNDGNEVFMRAFLPRVEERAWKAISAELRGKYIDFMVAQNIDLPPYTDPADWPPNMPFTPKFCNHQLELRERALTDSSIPLQFPENSPLKTALIGHIVSASEGINKRWFGLVTPRDLETLPVTTIYSENFMKSFLTKNNDIEWVKLPFQLYTQFFSYVANKAPRYADKIIIYTSWLLPDTRLPLDFIECYVFAHPHFITAKALGFLYPQFESYLRHEVDQIAEEIISTALETKQVVGESDEAEPIYAIDLEAAKAKKIVTLMAKGRDNLASELLDKLGRDPAILEGIKIGGYSDLVASRLPKEIDYELPSYLHQLWRSGREFASWVIKSSCYQQKSLLDAWYNALDEHDKFDAILVICERLGGEHTDPKTGKTITNVPTNTKRGVIKKLYPDMEAANVPVVLREMFIKHFKTRGDQW